MIAVNIITKTSTRMLPLARFEAPSFKSQSAKCLHRKYQGCVALQAGIVAFMRQKTPERGIAPGLWVQGFRGQGNSSNKAAIT